MQSLLVAVKTSHLRRDSTLVEKIEILNAVKNSKPGETQRKIAKRLGVGQMTLQKWLKEERELRTEWEAVQQNRHKGASITERNQMGKDDEIERRLFAFFSQIQGKGAVVTDELLMQKSKAIEKELGREFKPTVGWCDEFRMV